MSAELYTEYAISAAIGLVISIVIIKAGSGPALFKIEDDESSGLSSDSAEPSSAPVNQIPIDQKIPIINEEYAKKKLAPMQNMLGLTDEQMSTAIKDTNEQIGKTSDMSQLDSGDTLNSIVDGVVLLVAIAFGCYAVNVFTRGDFGRILAAMFPVEMDSLKLKDYLEKFHFVQHK